LFLLSPKHLEGSDSIFEFKTNENRVLCFFFVGKRVILTHGFKKKQPKTPKGEIERAENLKKEFEKLGFKVISQNFPDPMLARKKYWLPFLEKLGADENFVRLLADPFFQTLFLNKETSHLVH
jgi:hypothetical protein